MSFQYTNKYMSLMELEERNDTLFYKLLIDNVEELQIEYTPTAGEACQIYGSLFLLPQGLYITLEDLELNQVLWKIDELDQSFFTPPFGIRYARQDIRLPMMVAFTMSFTAFEKLRLIIGQQAMVSLHLQPQLTVFDQHTYYAITTIYLLQLIDSVVPGMGTVLFTCESVNEGHPDKQCDQVSHAILDTCLKQDPNSEVACETSTIQMFEN